MKAITIIKKLRYKYAQKYKHSINDNLLHYSNWLQDEIAELTMKQAVEPRNESVEVCPLCKGMLTCIPCTKQLCTPLTKPIEL